MSIEITQGSDRGETGRGLGSILLKVSKQKLIALVLTFDLISMWAIGLSFAVHSGQFHTSDGRFATATILIIPLLTVYILQRLWSYTIPALGAFVRQARGVLMALGGAFGLTMGFYFVVGLDLAGHRSWLLGWVCANYVALSLFRVMTSAVISAAEGKGELARRAVIVGGGKSCEELITRLERTGQRAIQILGTFDDRGDERSPGEIGNYRKIGTFDELESYCRDQGVDLLIVSLPQSAEERILHLLKKLWELPIDVRIAAHTSKLKLSKRAYSYIGDVPFLAVFDRPLSDWNAVVKSIFDWLVAALALVVLSPVMLLVALAIKFDSKGSVFFRQPRFGFNNELIHVLKFRSMYVETSDLDGAKQVARIDPRVTRVGRFIRKSSLDELPQLFNVLTGELSLVGPRPHAVQSKAGNRLYQDVVDGYFARHRMRPGITGWAQINGWRGETDTFEKLERRVEHDLHYIENWSLAFDVYILVMTPLSLLNTRNAY